MTRHAARSYEHRPEDMQMASAVPDQKTFQCFEPQSRERDMRRRSPRSVDKKMPAATPQPLRQSASFAVKTESNPTLPAERPHWSRPSLQTTTDRRRNPAGDNPTQDEALHPAQSYGHADSYRPLRYDVGCIPSNETCVLKLDPQAEWTRRYRSSPPQKRR